MSDMRLGLAFEKSFVAALAETCRGVYQEFGVGIEGNRAVSCEIESMLRFPRSGSIIGANLDMDEVGGAPVVLSHALERFPINSLFVDAQAAPPGFVLKHLMRQLIDPRTRFARPGVAS